MLHATVACRLTLAMSKLRSGGTRVLIVEDSVDARDMYALFLSISGLEVRVCGDGEEALRIATEWLPDVIVTDFMLAGRVNGAELCRLVHEEPRTRHIPTLVMTGSTRRSDAEAILGAGCADIRLKPYLPETMLADVRRLTSRGPAQLSA